MRKRADFLVKWDPLTESESILGEKILQSLFLGRLKQNKPCTIFLGGDSGEGKSYATLTVEQALLNSELISLKDVVNDINVYTPIQYPQKLNKILFEKEYKKIRLIAMHEAREVVKAKLWHSFVTQAVSDVNAMSRSIKPMVTIIVSQFIRDISNDMRYVLNFYIKADRPRGQHTRLYINVLFKDDTDLEKPKLRKRRIFGYVHNGKRLIKYSPKYVVVGLPEKEVRNAFDQADREAKESIIKKKLERVIKEIELDMGVGDSKISEMVKHYAEHPENLHLIGQQKRGKFIVNPEFKTMHGITNEESKLFQKYLNDTIIKKNIHQKEYSVTDEELEGAE